MSTKERNKASSESGKFGKANAKASEEPHKSSGDCTLTEPGQGIDKCSDEDINDSNIGGETFDTISAEISDSSVSGVSDTGPASTAAHFSSAPIMEAKRTSQKLGCSHRSNRTKFVKKTKSSYKPASRGASKSLRLSKKPEPVNKETSESEWESVSDMEVSADDSEAEGALTIDVDGKEEKLEESQIPLQEQLEETIASGSARNNLSVSNVKNIIWTLLTHDLVKEMLKTKLGACGDEEGDVFEPKLTRSKMKEVLEKGNDAIHWPVSPSKLGHSSTAGPSILDMEFSEDEDEEDAEYEPSKDAELESDDESVTSSQVSDMGSPYPFSSPRHLTPGVSVRATPTTPSSGSRIGVSQQPAGSSAQKSPSDKAAESENAVNAMGPPVGQPVLTHSAKQRLVFRSPKKQIQEAEENGIAGRTRSKLPLTTTSLYDIEEAFVAPDITADMYDTMCDDTDWQEFLKSLHKAGDADTQNESLEQGEEDDPEFNYTEAEDMEEACFGGHFRVSRKELNSLMEELEDLFNEDDYSMIGLRTNLASAHENAALLAKKPVSTPGSSSQREHSEAGQEHPSQKPGSGVQQVGSARAEVEEEGEQEELSAAASAAPEVHGTEVSSVTGTIAGNTTVAGILPVVGMSTEARMSAALALKDHYPMVLDHQLKLIEEHMRKHIQLTTQMYVLAQGSDDFCPIADTCKKMLCELDMFTKTSLIGSKSAFNACNLAGALGIINCNIDWALHRQQRTEQERNSIKNQPSASVPLAVDSASSTQKIGCKTVNGKNIERESRTEAADSVTVAQEQAHEVGAVGDSVTVAQEQGCQTVTGHNVGNKNSVGRSKKSSKQRAGHPGSVPFKPSQSQKQLLEIQKSILWTSPVFLYPSLLPEMGLVPRIIFEQFGRFYFCSSEDALLVLGKEQFKNVKVKGMSVYRLIHHYMMPSKSEQKLYSHFHCKRQDKNNVIMRYKETGELPKGPEVAEEFSLDMMKAPCDQPLDVLPNWCHKKLQMQEMMQWTKCLVKRTLQEESKVREELKGLQSSSESCEQKRLKKIELEERMHIKKRERERLINWTLQEKGRLREELGRLQSLLGSGRSTERSTESQHNVSCSSSAEPPVKRRRNESGSQPELVVETDPLVHPITIQSAQAEPSDQPVTIQSAQAESSDQPIFIQSAQAELPDQPINIKSAQAVLPDQPVTIQSLQTESQNQPITMQSSEAELPDQPIIIQSSQLKQADQPVIIQSSQLKQPKQPVIIQSCPTSTERGEPSTLVMSQGLYVSLDLADMKKLRKALAACQAVVVSELGDQRTVCMDQYLKEMACSDAELYRTLLSLCEPAGSSETAFVPMHRAGELMGQIQGSPCMNPEHSPACVQIHRAGETVDQSQDSFSVNPQHSDASVHTHRSHYEENNMTPVQSSPEGQDSEMNSKKTEATQKYTHHQVSACSCKKKNSNKETETSENASRVPFNSLVLTGDKDSSLSLTREELLCKQDGQDSVSPRNVSVCEMDSSREGSGDKSDMSWGEGSSETPQESGPISIRFLQLNSVHETYSQKQTENCVQFIREAPSKVPDFHKGTPSEMESSVSQTGLCSENVIDLITASKNLESDNLCSDVIDLTADSDKMECETFSKGKNDQSNTAEVSGHRKRSFAGSAVKTGSLPIQPEDQSSGNSRTTREHDLDGSTNRNVQNSLPATSSCSSQSVHVSLVYHVHLTRSSDQILQPISEVPAAGKFVMAKSHSPDKHCPQQFSDLCNMMKKALGGLSTDCWLDKYLVQEDQESLNFGCAKPSWDKWINPGIILTIIVSMMYSADYTEDGKSEDTAESPSSTTPDGNDGQTTGQGETSEQGGTSSQGQTSHQGETHDERESSLSEASDDCVSTTSGICGVQFTDNSAQLLIQVGNSDRRDTINLGSSSVCADSSSVPTHASIHRLSQAEQSCEVFSEIIPVSSVAGSFMTVPATTAYPGMEEEQMNSVSSSSLVRRTRRDVHCEPLPGSEVSSSGRSQPSDEQLHCGDSIIGLPFGSLEQVGNFESLQGPSTSYAIPVQSGLVFSQDHTQSQSSHSAIADTSDFHGMGPSSSVVGSSQPGSSSQVVNSSPLFLPPVAGSVSWTSISSVDSSADSEGSGTSSAEISGSVQGSFPVQDFDSGIDVSTSETNIRVNNSGIDVPRSETNGGVSNSGIDACTLEINVRASVFNCSTSAGAVEDFGVFPGDGVAQSQGFSGNVGTADGCAVSGLSAVSSSDLSSEDLDTPFMQFPSREPAVIAEPSREAASSICEPSTSSMVDSYQEDPMKSVRDTEKTSGQSHVVMEAQNSLRLLQLMESGNSISGNPDCSHIGVLEWSAEMIDGSEDTVTSDEDLPFKKREASVQREMSTHMDISYVQSINEHSPPPHDRPSLARAGLSAVDTSLEQQQFLKMSTQPVSSEYPETPMMLSSLGLVSIRGTGSDLTHGSAAQSLSESGDGSGMTVPLTPLFLSPVSALDRSLGKSPPAKSPGKSPSAIQPENLPSSRSLGRSPFSPFRTLAPKPGPVTYPIPPFLPRHGSPKKQQLQKRVRAILPKGYSYEVRMNSPTKAAARTLKRKATLICQRSPIKPLLPKDPSMKQMQGNPFSTTTLPPWTRKGRKPKCQATISSKVIKMEPQLPPLSAAVTSKRTPLGHEESDETGSEIEDVALMSQDDSQNEEEVGEDDSYMHTLMAASTTIGYNPYIKTTPETPDKDDYYSIMERRRRNKLSLLSPDILETDPRKDNRDLTFAQSFMNKVKMAMHKDISTYIQFMDILRQFEISQASPVEMYESICGLLANYPELLEEFSAFLQPGQALQNRCHVPNQVIHNIRAFLRKLELIYHRNRRGGRYSKILRLLARANFKTKSPAVLHQQLLPLMAIVPRHILDEFAYLFPEAKPPESHMESDDFEDITLRDSDDEGNRSPDDFEDITFPDENDPYRTRRCPCVCHGTLSKRKKREKYTHCYNCCLRVVEGQLYFQPSNVTTRRPVSATFYDPVPMPLPSDLPPPSARSRGTFHHSAILDEADDDDLEDEEDDIHMDTEDEKDEKPDTDDDEDEEDEEEEDEDMEDEEEEEEEEECSPSKQPRLTPVKEAGPCPSTVKVALSPPKEQTQLLLPLESGTRSSSPHHQTTQQLTIAPKSKNTLSTAQQKCSDQNSIVTQQSAQQGMNQCSIPSAMLKQCLNPPQLLTQNLVAQQLLTQQPLAQQLLAQCPLVPPGMGVSPQSQCFGMEEGMSLLTRRRPASPSQSLPSAALGKMMGMPKPGESNLRMRKRILSMKPGRQVSSSMQTLAPKLGLPPEGDSGCTDVQSGGPISPSLLSGAGPTTWKTSRVKTLGTVSVVGPDNIVIMFNPTLATPPALGDTLPSLHEPAAFFPLPSPAGVGDKMSEGSGRQGGMKEERASLPTITSPHKNMQKGSFAGFLQGSQTVLGSGKPATVSFLSSEKEPCGSVLNQCISASQLVNDKQRVSKSQHQNVLQCSNSETLTSSTATTSATATVSSGPLLSEDTFSALFGHMTEEGGQVLHTTLSIDESSSASMLLLTKMMHPESTQQEGEESDPVSHSAPVPITAAASPRTLDLSVSSLSSCPSPTPTPQRGSANVQHHYPKQPYVQWTREQDKVIVEMVQAHGVSEKTCDLIAARLCDITSAQVSQRVSALMEFLDLSVDLAVEKNVH